MRRQMITSTALAMCLCMFSLSTVHACEEIPLPLKDVHAERTTAGLVACDSTIPSPGEIYQAMVALQDQDAYKEGTPWTDYEPYSDEKGYYNWRGGLLNGKRIDAVGCVAFAFILSDAAFGDLQARMYAAGDFKYEDIKVGDILRVNNDTHTVIVLETSDVGVVIAEGNISSGDNKGVVHWGRTLSREDVMNNASHYITRYPEDYVSPEDPDANAPMDAGAQGTLATGLHWNLTKAGTLTISGSGAIPDFSSAGEQPWNAYGSRIRKVIMEEGVTGIGSCAFWNCGVLSAEIPSSVTEVGNSAFRGSSLISVTIPASVKRIGDSAFRECEGLSSVTVSEGVETIEQNAFRACTSLTSAALPASIGEVGAAAFFECTAMTDAVFAPGSRQVKMGANLFARCYYLMNVTLPQNIDCISDEMFLNCSMLGGLEIPQGAASIGNSAFASTGVSVVVIPDTVETIGIAAFAQCPLSDIYFTGTEAQWDSINKIGDTAQAVSKATVHYGYSSNPDGDDDNDDNGEDTGGDNTGENVGDSNESDGEGSGEDNTGENAGDDNESGSDDAGEDNSGEDAGDGGHANDEGAGGDSSDENAGGDHISYEDDIIDRIAAAEENSTIVFNRDCGINTLSNGMMKTLAERGDVSLVLEYTYEGVDYIIKIPAGKAVENDIPWYGPLYLASVYGNSVSSGISGGSKYTVQKNDTMSGIARAHGMTLAKLAKMNPQITNIDQIRVGQIINIK